MLPFTVIRQPDCVAALAALSPARDRELLVLYHGELPRREFLSRILAAAGYADPGTELHLLEWPANEPLDLSALLRTLNVRKVMLFGYDLPALGIHLELSTYTPATVASVCYLACDSLEHIEDAKADGNNGPAGALWNAIQQSFKKC